VLQAELSGLIGLISKLQSPDGSWSLPQWMHGNQDSTCEVTALCLLALARNRDRSPYDEHISKASAWLCSAQRHDGSWTSSGARHSKGEPDLLTTAFAREALAISTQNFGKHVERATSYIVEEQQPLGNWTNQHFHAEFLTAIVVDCLIAEWPDVLPQFANEHLRMARELLPRGQRLLCRSVRFSARHRCSLPWLGSVIVRLLCSTGLGYRNLEERRPNDWLARSVGRL
jgi:hypothetical protein